MCGLGILSPRNLKYSRVTIIQNRRDARILFELSGVLANMTRDNIPPCVVMKHLHIFDNTTFTHTSKDRSPAFARVELGEGHLCRYHKCHAYPACSLFFFFINHKRLLAHAVLFRHVYAGNRLYLWLLVIQGCRCAARSIKCSRSFMARTSEKYELAEFMQWSSLN